MKLGQFKTRSIRMAKVTPPPNTVEVWKTEEKGSDVNLATALLSDGFNQLYEVAVVISNDSDLAWPVEVVRKELGCKVGVLVPEVNRRKWSIELRSAATFFRGIRDVSLAASQFPAALHDANGTFGKPATWP